MKKVLDIFHVEEYATSGEVGIEIEVEGCNLPSYDLSMWRREYDGSLRGRDNAEYVLDQPVKRGEVTGVLAYLNGLYKQNNTEVDESMRTGVHIHVNVQELTITELYNFMTIYIILEELLVKYCGEYREGNYFCLRAKDAEYLLAVLSETAVNKQFYLNFTTDNLRYASMNVKSLGTYGSLEFRAMRGTRYFEEIDVWAKTLLRIKDASKKFMDPVDIINHFSGDVVDSFLNMVLGDYAGRYRCGGYKEMMLDGVRLAQDVAYATNWREMREWSDGKEEEKPDFGAIAEQFRYKDNPIPAVPPVRRYKLDLGGDVVEDFDCDEEEEEYDEEEEEY